MRSVEFEVSDGAPGDAAGSQARAERSTSTLPWFLLLAALLIGAGSGLAHQTGLSLFAAEQHEAHYLIEDPDGGVTAWSWRADYVLDDRTVSRVGAHLASIADVPDWSCRDAAEPDAPAAPYPEAGGIVCSGQGCFVEGTAEDVAGCTSTAWISPAGRDRPEDGLADTD